MKINKIKSREDITKELLKNEIYMFEAIVFSIAGWFICELLFKSTTQKIRLKLFRSINSFNKNLGNNIYKSAAKQNSDNLSRFSLFLIVLGYFILISFVAFSFHSKSDDIIKEVKETISHVASMDKGSTNLELKNKSVDSGDIKVDAYRLELALKSLKQSRAILIVLMILVFLVIFWTYLKNVFIYELNQKFKHDLKIIGYKLSGKQIRLLEYKWVTMNGIDDYKALMEEIKKA